MHDEHHSAGGAPVLDCESESLCRVVACAVCLKEVPGDAGLSADVQDYVLYFCGLDCFSAWKQAAAPLT